MKKLLVFLCSFFFAAVASFAQVEYSVVKNDPLDVPNLFFYLNPVVLEYYGVNSNAGVSVGSSFNLGNIAEIEGYYRIAYADKEMHAEELEYPEIYFGIPLNGKQNFRKWGATGTYFFSKSTKSEETSVTVRSDGNTDYVIKVPADYYRAFGARIGYNALLTLIGGPEDEFKIAGHMVDTPSIALKNWGSMGGSMVDYQTMMFVNTLSVGISKTTIMELVINTKQFGEKTSFKRNIWYVDALFATNISMDDMLVFKRIGTHRRQDVFTLADSEFNPFGLRAGYILHGNDPLNFILTAEAGLQPGVAPVSIEQQIYATLSLGMSIGVKAK